MLRKLFLFLLLFLFVGFEVTFGGEIKKTIEFSPDALVFSKSGEFDVVYLSGCNLTDQIGAPQLPVRSISFSLPANSRVEGVEINSYVREEIEGIYDIFPVQPPQILSLNKDKKDKIPFTSPDSKIYSSSQAYPGRIAELSGSGYLGGFQIADILVYPLEYMPREKRLFLYKKIDLTLHYVAEESRSIPFKKRSQLTRRIFDKILDKKLLNPKEEIQESTLKETTLLDPGDYEYVIITRNMYASYFQPLADWKTKKGVPATVVTKEWIISNYSGIDYQERFRNFIIDAYQNWGTVWVLLGADTFVIPARLAYAMTCYAGMHLYEDSIACDLYYADLDGNWNSDGDGIFGEVEDDVDMYPEVFVGRASVSSGGGG